MQIKVRLIGLEQAQARLAAQQKKIDPVLRGALNTTATKSRAERYVKPLAKTIAPKRTRAAMKIKRARRGMMNSRVIPSGASVPVIDYKTWGYDVIDATRARIWVRGPNGRKTAAGFVNPSSKHKLPLQTRSSKTVGAKTYEYKRLLQIAGGLSVAYWFRDLTTAQTVRWVNAYLHGEFNKRMIKELNK